MNSLTDLNTRSLTSLDYTDNRDYKITFEDINYVNDSVKDLYLNTSVQRDWQRFKIQPYVDIASIVNPSTTITYVLDMGKIVVGGQDLSYQKPELTWTTTLPAHITVTRSTSALHWNPNCVWTITGIRDKNDWDVVKSPICTLTANLDVYSNGKEYGANIRYPSYGGASYKYARVTMETNNANAPTYPYWYYPLTASNVKYTANTTTTWTGNVVFANATTSGSAYHYWGGLNAKEFTLYITPSDPANVVTISSAVSSSGVFDSKTKTLKAKFDRDSSSMLNSYVGSLTFKPKTGFTGNMWLQFNLQGTTDLSSQQVQTSFNLYVTKA